MAALDDDLAYPDHRPPPTLPPACPTLITMLDKTGLN
jgi:hypothetical protein